MPSLKWSLSSAATCRPRRVWPLPPGPVRGSKRTSCRSSGGCRGATSRSSPRRGGGMGGKSGWGGQGGRGGNGGTRKGEEKGASLCIDLVTLRLMESRAQHLPALSQHTAILLTYLLQQERRPFDISEEQCDRSRREIKHARPPRHQETQNP